MINLEEALQEISEKNYATIQTETAWKWLSRSAAYYETCSLEKDFAKKLVWWTLGEEMLHEAVEHAALVNDEGSLIKEVREAINVYQENAASTMGVDPKKANVP